jgi:hypothetical protein
VEAQPESGGCKSENVNSWWLVECGELEERELLAGGVDDTYILHNT